MCFLGGGGGVATKVGFKSRGSLRGVWLANYSFYIPQYSHIFNNILVCIVGGAGVFVIICTPHMESLHKIKTTLALFKLY